MSPRIRIKITCLRKMLCLQSFFPGERNQSTYANHLATIKAVSPTSKAALLAQLDQLKNKIQQAHLRDLYLKISHSFEEDYSEIGQNISSWLDDL